MRWQRTQVNQHGINDSSPKEDEIRLFQARPERYSIGNQAYLYRPQPMSENFIAKAILTGLGASVEPIPTSHKEESDWLATLLGFRLLVEEKTKFENPERTAERNEALNKGRVHGTFTSLKPNNRISGIIGKAAKQLRSTGADYEHDARILWFTSTGSDRKTKDRQAFNTLYGVTNVFNLDASNSLQRCYFFHNSEFFRHQDLDGACLALTDGKTASVRLCLNPFSERWKSLRDSPFAVALADGLVDPIADEAAGMALIADTDIDRRDGEAVLTFLREKYRIPKLLNIDMFNAQASIRATPKDP